MNYSLGTIVNDSRFFFIAQSSSGQDIWVSDGTPGNSKLYYDLAPFSLINKFFSYKQKLYFIGLCDSAYGIEIYYIDPNFIGIKTPVKNKLLVYPNPASPGQVIQLGLNATALVQLFNSDGKLIYEDQTNAQLILPDYLCSGIYFIRITSDEYTQTCKILVE